MLFDKFGIVDLKLLNNLSLINDSLQFKGSRLLKGSYLDVNFQASNLKAKHDSKEVKTDELCLENFYGRWFIFELLNNSKEKIIIVDKSLNIQTNDLTLIKSDNLKFNSLFNVYVSNINFGKSFLNEDLIIKILKMKEKDTSKLYVVLDGDKFHLGFDNKKQSLKIDYKKKVNKQLIIDFMQDLKQVKDIVDDLKLDNKYFSKIKEK